MKKSGESKKWASAVLEEHFREKLATNKKAPRTHAKAINISQKMKKSGFTKL
jgi:hypothetical protein